MKATVNTKIDGQYYSVGEEIHDLGNWEPIENDKQIENEEKHSVKTKTRGVDSFGYCI